MDIIREIINIIQKLLGLASNKPDSRLDQDIANQEDRIKEVENENRDVNDIIDDLNKK